MKRKLAAVLAVLLAATLVVAGCGSQPSSSGQANGNGNNGSSSGNTQGNGNAGSSQSAQGKVEIFSWWTGGDGGAALKALLKTFRNKYPSIKVVNAAVAGGAGTNAHTVLANRMKAGNPPDTFQIHAGAALNDGWAKAGKMQSLNQLYKQQGWNQVFPKQLLKMVSSNGNRWSVPIDMHRANVLWYNKSVFKKAGLKPPSNVSEMLKDAKKLKQQGITPIALADKNTWPATNLFEAVLLSKLGPAKYKQLWTGNASFDTPDVRAAVNTFGQLLKYTNSNHAALTWQQGTHMVGSGKAAMNVMGDWAEGYLTTTMKLKPNKDFGWVFLPQGTFDMVVDSFGLPKGAPHPQNAKKLLKVIGSKAGQDAFDPLKGAISPRKDSDLSKYNVYSKENAKKYHSDQLVPSLTHGSAAGPTFLNKVNNAVNAFVTTKDTDTFIKALQNAKSDLNK